MHKKGSSDFAIPVPSGVEEIELKEVPTDYEIPHLNGPELLNKPRRVQVGLCPAYGIATTSQHVKGTIGDGIYETIY